MPLAALTSPSTFTDEHLVTSIRAGKKWSKTRDLPDIVGLADFSYAPELALPALRSRLGAIPAHRTSTLFPLPKPSGRHRPLLYADTIDEAVYRAVVGRIAANVDGALGPEVHSYRLRCAWPTWELRHYHYGDVARRAEVQQFAIREGFGALAKIDVERYFPSIKRDLLGQVLRDEVGCGLADVAQVVALLENWNETWSVPGVPIGPEASGILGNAMLMPLDAALRAKGIAFNRFTDDVMLLLPKGCDWKQLLEHITEALEPLDLSLNSSKTLYTEDPLEARLVAGVDRQLDRASAALNEDRLDGLRLVRWMFDNEVERPDPSMRRVRFALLTFKNHADPHALDAVMEQPRLWTEAAKHCGQYLARMHEVGRVDVDWLVDQALTKPVSSTAATRYHQLLALRGGRRRLAKATGDALRELALAPSSLWTPVRVAAADALPKTNGWAPGESLTAAREVGDAMLRRALVLSARNGPTPSRRDLDRLEAFEECRPALAWVRSLRS